MDFILPNLAIEAKLSYDGKTLKNGRFYAESTGSEVIVASLKKPEKSIIPVRFPWELPGILSPSQANAA